MSTSEVRVEKTEKSRRVRRITAVLAAALAATIGVGFVAQSPSLASTAGGQLPWDDGQSGPGEGHRHGGRPGHGMNDPVEDGDSSDMPDESGPMPGRRMGMPRELLDSAAQALGMTADEVLSELKDKKSIADIANERNIDVQVVVDALVKTATENIVERITAVVNHRLGDPMPKPSTPSA